MRVRFLLSLPFCLLHVAVFGEIREKAGKDYESKYFGTALVEGSGYEIRTGSILTITISQQKFKNGSWTKSHSWKVVKGLLSKVGADHDKIGLEISNKYWLGNYGQEWLPVHPILRIPTDDKVQRKETYKMKVQVGQS